MYELYITYISHIFKTVTYIFFLFKKNQIYTSISQNLHDIFFNTLNFFFQLCAIRESTCFNVNEINSVGYNPIRICGI